MVSHVLELSCAPFHVEVLSIFCLVVQIEVCFLDQFSYLSLNFYSFFKKKNLTAGVIYIAVRSRSLNKQITCHFSFRANV